MIKIMLLSPVYIRKWVEKLNKYGSYNL
jgi:DNA-directed RNA polymerase beta' subunit